MASPRPDAAAVRATPTDLAILYQAHTLFDPKLLEQERLRQRLRADHAPAGFAMAARPAATAQRSELTDRGAPTATTSPAELISTVRDERRRVLPATGPRSSGGSALLDARYRAGRARPASCSVTVTCIELTASTAGC